MSNHCLGRQALSRAGREQEPKVENCLTGVRMGTEMTLIMGSLCGQTGWSVSRAGMGTNKCLMSAGEGSVKEYSLPWALRSGRCSEPGSEGNNCGTRRHISIDMCHTGGCQSVCL